jgi:Domain of unknown function (DUF4178)
VAGSRALGLGLVAGGVGLALLMLLWLAVSGAGGGGIVLGLMLLFVLAAPLIGAGVYVLNQQKSEAIAAAAFADKRRVLESDRLFRRELAADLRQLAARPNYPTARLTEIAQDLERRSYDSPEWYDTVHLSDSQLSLLHRYDDSAWERVRWLGNHDDAPPEQLSEAVRDLVTTLDQRRDLLLRGREAPAVAPSAMLRAGEPRRDAQALRDLAVGDAITYDGTDYLVEGVASYFSQGQTWKLAHLVASRPGVPERWLYVGPNALEAAVLDDLPAGQGPAGQTLSVDGAELPLATTGSATVDVESQAGQARGVLVSYTLYRADPRLGLVDRWPDGAVHAYAGRLLRAGEVDIWPATVRTNGGSGLRVQGSG